MKKSVLFLLGLMLMVCLVGCEQSLADASPSKVSVASPTITPNGESILSTDPITLVTTTPGAKIYYTLNGDNPTTSSTLYAGVLTLPSADAIIKAIAVHNDMLPSEVAISDSYNFEVPSGSFALSAGLNEGADASGVSWEGSPEQLVVVKVFDTRSRAHIPAVANRFSAYELPGTKEQVTHLTFDEEDGKWHGTIVLDPKKDYKLEEENLVFLLLAYPDKTENKIIRTGTGKSAGNSVAISALDGFATSEDGTFGHNGFNIGPAGGYIFYQGLLYSGEWRYLEAAPWFLEKYIFGYDRTHSDGSNLFLNTETGIGKGKSNTVTLVGAMGETAYTKSTGDTTTGQYAAKICSDHVVGEYDDWFLPSKDELNKMYENLRQKGIGDCHSDYHWSSSESDTSGNVNAWSHWFQGGNQREDISRDIKHMVHPVRAF